MSPAYATALLVDRIPAFAPFFYNTGSQISFHWKQLLETFVVINNSEYYPICKAKYHEAIEMLYGGSSGYKMQQKTELFKGLDTLRTKWEEAKDELQKVRAKFSQKGQDLPEKYELNMKPYMDRVDDAFSEYDSVRSQVKQYQAAIFQHTRGDLNILLFQQRQGKHLSY